MKKIVIGRGHDCDIIINDTTDVVSRRQAAIAFDFFGNMTIYDLSTNGTFVNGVRVPKPAGIPLKRTDSVNFGSVCDFDMNRVRDPYHNTRIILAAIVVAVLLIGGALAYYFTREDEPVKPACETIEIPAVGEQKDTVPAESVTVQEPETKPEVEKKSPEVSKKPSKKPNPKPGKTVKPNKRAPKINDSPVEDAAPTERIDKNK